MRILSAAIERFVSRAKRPDLPHERTLILEFAPGDCGGLKGAITLDQKTIEQMYEDFFSPELAFCPQSDVHLNPNCIDLIKLTKSGFFNHNNGILEDETPVGIKLDKHGQGKEGYYTLRFTSGSDGKEHEAFLKIIDVVKQPARKPAQSLRLTH